MTRENPKGKCNLDGKNIKRILIGFFLALIIFFAPTGTFSAQSLPGIDIDLAPYLERIERMRKKLVRISITDKTGKPMSNVQVKIQQTSHAFFFGNAPEYLLFAYARFHYMRGGRFGTRPLPPEKIEEYKSLYLDLFNYATVPAFYWADYEPTPDRLPLLDATNQIVKWLNSNGVTVKGHTLVWGNPPSVGVPGWVQAMGVRGEWDGVRAALYRRVEREVSEFKGKIQMWDVVNEPIVQPWFDNIGSNYIAEMYSLVKKIDPNAILVFNEFGILVNDHTRRKFIEKAQALLEAGVPIDVIGVEAHIFNGQDLKNQLRMLNKIYSALDELAVLGKPIHITEFQIPLPAVMEAFGVDTATAEQLQAEIARIFYTVFFSHPAVEAIIYWNFYRAWQPGSGFLRDDLTLKPIYFVLKDLIHREWKTLLEGVADETGQLSFTGFPGTYKVTVRLPDGKEEDFTIQVMTTGNSYLSLTISDPS